MLISNEFATDRQDWDIDQLCEASTLIYPVLPARDTWACTPILFEVHTLPFKSITQKPNHNYYVFMEARQDVRQTRFREGIYRHFGDIERQVAVEDMKKNNVFTKGFHTLDEAREFWKERCPQVHSRCSEHNRARDASYVKQVNNSASYTKSLLVMRELLLLHPSLATKVPELVSVSDRTSPLAEPSTLTAPRTPRTTRFIRPRDSPLSPSASTSTSRASGPSKKANGVPLPFPDPTFSLYVVNGDDTSIVERFDGLREAFFAALEARGKIAMFLAPDESLAIEQWVNIRGGDGDVYETSYRG
ncbi:hypothetical protein VNI00_018677 [Paramarasmius palmivorus]|uniref:Uncharacterized protein n=1 Tax=Paramarasmius palmivorus TaxID=297713 RepID=A0AAW0AWE0_9AGAR